VQQAHHSAVRNRYTTRLFPIVAETMTFAYWMLIAAAVLPYLTIALAKSGGRIDNRAPRPSLETLSGW